MSINKLLPDRRRISQNDTDTLFDLRGISLQYKIGKIKANEAMDQVNERLNKNAEDYNKTYQPWYDALTKGEDKNDK